MTLATLGEIFRKVMFLIGKVLILRFSPVFPHEKKPAFINASILECHSKAQSIANSRAHRIFLPDEPYPEFEPLTLCWDPLLKRDSIPWGLELSPVLVESVSLYLSYRLAWPCPMDRPGFENNLWASPML